MPSAATPPPHAVDPFLKKQIQWLLLCRVLALSVLLGISVLLQTPGQHFLPQLKDIGYFIALVYAFTITSALFLRRVTNYQQFAVWQIVIDILLTTLLVYYTGASQSIFTLVFFFPIISTGLLALHIYRFLLTFLCAASYGVILFLEYQGYYPFASASLPMSPLQTPTSLYYRIAVPVVTFILVAFLSALLAERLRRTEQALDATSQSLDRLALLYRQIVNDIDTGIITTDHEGRITSCNKAAEEITGFKNHEVLGLSLKDAFPGLGGAMDKQFRSTTEIRRRDGGHIPVGFNRTRLNMPDEPEAGRIYTFQDLSQIKQMEEQVRQAEKMAGIGEMAAGIAHEFRNPLAAIAGSAQMLEDDGANRQNQRLLAIILRESERLEQAINDFLQFSRPSPPEKQWFLLLPLSQEVDQLLQQAGIIGPRLQLQWTINERLECYADRGQLRQVLLNLLTNSVQLIGDNGGEVTIDAAERTGEQAPTAIIITIRDTGPGIAPANQERLFEPFFTTREDGTGLGLAIVWQIIDSHGGRIKAGNNPTGGAWFQLSLPLP